jgi:hypothetical protein
VILAAFVLPPNTTTDIIGTPINLDILFRLMSPFLVFGLSLEIVSTWGNAPSAGKIQRAIGGTAKALVPAFLYLVPLEVAFIILFVAVSLRVPLVWRNFSSLFAIGLYGLLLIFTWRWFWHSIKSIYELLHRFYEWIYPLKFRKNVIRKPDPNRTPWFALFLDALKLVWVYGVMPVIAIELIAGNNLLPDLNIPSVLVLVTGFAALILVTLFILALNWRHRHPRKPSPP